MYRIPTPRSPMINAIRHRKRTKAILYPRHLCGLALDAGKELMVELLEPSREPFVPPKDFLFPTDEFHVPRQYTEPVLSIYSEDLGQRIILPLREIADLTLVPDGQEETLSEFRELVAAHAAAGYLLITKTTGEKFLLACPRRLRGARKIVEYYRSDGRPAEAPVQDPAG